MYKLLVADLGSPSYFVATAAVVLGFFEAEGIAMEPVQGSIDGTDSLKDGTAHFFGGAAYKPLDTFPNFEGVRLLCSLSHYSYWFMGIRADLPVERGSIEALKGLRISTSFGAPGQGLRRLLIESGLDLERDHVQIVKSPSAGKNQTFRGSDGIVALQSGISDAFWGNGMRLAMAVRSGIAKLHLDLRRGDGPPGARFYNFPALMASQKFIDERPDLAAGAVRAIVRTQQALRRDPSLATSVGKQVFPAEEAELIAELVANDAPFYDADISTEAADGLLSFCLDSGLMSKTISYDALVATQFADLWRA
jgi:NitT/TauT family transport system substrate-binding protein